MSIKDKHHAEMRMKILGIELGDAIGEAHLWWEAKGKEIFRHRNYSNEMKFQQNNLNVTDPNHPQYLGRSGIMLGLDWSDLTPTERSKVVMVRLLERKEADDKRNEGLYGM